MPEFWPKSVKSLSRLRCVSPTSPRLRPLLCSTVKRHKTLLLLQYFISQRGCSIWKNTIETDHLSPALRGCVGGTKIGCWLVPTPPPCVGAPYAPATPPPTL